MDSILTTRKALVSICAVLLAVIYAPQHAASVTVTFDILEAAGYYIPQTAHLIPEIPAVSFLDSQPHGKEVTVGVLAGTSIGLILDRCNVTILPE